MRRTFRSILVLFGVAVQGTVRGVAELGNKLYIIEENSSKLDVYDAQTFRLVSVIPVKGLTDPVDIVACRDDRQIFVAESDAIWRVSTTVRHQYDKWMTIESVGERL